MAVPGLWDSMRKAAVAGAAHVAVGAEQAAKRLELQRRLGAKAADVEAHYAAVGRLGLAAVRAGAAALPGADAHVAAIEAAEAEIARLRAELDKLGG